MLTRPYANIWSHRIKLTLSVCVIAASGFVIVSNAPSGSAYTSIESTSALLESLDMHDGDSVIAIVNGAEIQRKTLSIHMATSTLLGLGDAREEEILDALIDDVLITQEAQRHGISVDSWEVTAAIHAGILYPVTDPATSEEVKRFIGVVLDIHKVSPEDAATSLELRAAYEGMILRGRYLQEIKVSRSDVIGGLRSQAKIIIVERDD